MSHSRFTHAISRHSTQRWFQNLLCILIAVCVLLVIFILSWQLNFDRGDSVLGVTFSAPYAEWMGLDARQTYLAILDDLQPKKVRLATYWDRIAPDRKTEDLTELDWQLQEAARHGTEVMLAIGYRTPRWPECHTPKWAAALPKPEFKQALMNHLAALVEHFKKSPALAGWQVENEPYLSVFGKCPPPDTALLNEELAFVKRLDPNHPTVVTDSGELSVWPRASGVSDIFGTTLYRNIWGVYTGAFTYRYPPAFYTLRATLTEKFSSTKQSIIAELQAEPWAIGDRSLIDVPFDEQTKYFDTNELEANVWFARATGIRDIYLWGPEWWYWRKQYGDASFWETGKKLIAEQQATAMVY